MKLGKDQKDYVFGYDSKSGKTIITFVSKTDGNKLKFATKNSSNKGRKGKRGKG